MSELRQKEQWNGSHQNISYEIQHFGFSGSNSMNGGKGIWTGYLYINEEMFPENGFDRYWLEQKTVNFGSSERKTYDYFELPFEVHSGLTYYSKESGFDEDPRGVKVGWDYNHLWDMESGYPACLETVQHDCERAIDVFLQWNQDLNVRCGYNGRWYPKDQGKENEHGTWWSFEGTKKWEESKAKDK